MLAELVVCLPRQARLMKTDYSNTLAIVWLFGIDIFELRRCAQHRRDTHEACQFKAYSSPCPADPHPCCLVHVADMQQTCIRCTGSRCCRLADVVMLINALRLPHGCCNGIKEGSTTSRDAAVWPIKLRSFACRSHSAQPPAAEPPETLSEDVLDLLPWGFPTPHSVRLVWRVF